MILGREGLADYHCGLQGLEVPVSSGNLLHHPACTFTANSCPKLGRLKAKGWCELEPLSSEASGTPCDLRARSSVDKVEISSDSSGLHLGGEGIVLYIDLPSSPCEDSIELDYYKAHEKPIEKRSGFRFGVDFSNNTSSTCVPVDCLDCELHGIVSRDAFCRSTALRSPLEDRIEDSLVLDANSGSGSEVQEMLDAVPSLDMPSSSMKDGLVGQALLLRGETDVVGVTDVPRDAREQLKTAVQGMPVAIRVGNSQAKMPSKGSHALRALLETENVQKFMKRRLVTPLVSNPGCVSEVQENVETVPSLEVHMLPRKERIAELGRRGNEGMVGPGLASESCEQSKTVGQVKIASGCEETIASRKTSNSGVNALRAMIESDDVQKFSERGTAVVIGDDAGNVSEFPNSQNPGSRSAIVLPLAKDTSTELVEPTGDKKALTDRGLVTELQCHQELKPPVPEVVPFRTVDSIEEAKSSKIATNTMGEVSVQRIKRRRLTTPIDTNIGNVTELPEKRETVAATQLSSGKDRKLEEGVLNVLKDRLANSGYDQRSVTGRRELTGDSVEDPVKSRLSHSHVHADNLQNFKRRRLTTPLESAVLKDKSQVSDNAVLVAQESSAVPFRNNLREDSCALTSNLEMPLTIDALNRRSADDIGDKEVLRSADSEVEKSAFDMINMKSDNSSDLSSPRTSSGRLEDIDTLDKYISRPPRQSDVSSDSIPPKKKEWLAKHHGDEALTAIAQDAGFAGNVGCCYRSAIDARPAAQHPGFVGDGATVQFCRVCGEREDATGSLICDSCEEVFHMTCVNSRMKIVPRVDEWLCRPCKKKRKMSRESENQGDSDAGGEPKDWWRDDAGIGRIDRELLRMSNGRRMKVRIGPKYQAEVPDWSGVVEEVDLHDTLAETGYRFGEEVPLTSQEKQSLQEQGEYNLAHNIWPMGWLPVTQLPPGSKENWLQCSLVLFDEGDIMPDGHKAEKDIICGKWRRAPINIVSNDQWECSCALVWDPRHADCAVPQELSNEEISERMKASKIPAQQMSAV